MENIHYVINHLCKHRIWKTYIMISLINNNTGYGNLNDLCCEHIWKPYIMLLILFEYRIWKTFYFIFISFKLEFYMGLQMKWDVSGIRSALIVCM